jgi:hypothetical protein
VNKDWDRQADKSKDDLHTHTESKMITDKSVVKADATIDK